MSGRVIILKKHEEIIDLHSPMQIFFLTSKQRQNSTLEGNLFIKIYINDLNKRKHLEILDQIFLTVS